jgi:hypothetical protein
MATAFSRMKSIYLVLTLAALLCLLTACDRNRPASSLPPNAVATVNGRPIPRDAFERELFRSLQARAGRAKDVALEKSAVLERMINFEVVYQKAEAAGYDKDPQIIESLRRMVVAKYEEDQAILRNPPKATPEEIEDFYQRRPERFGQPERIRAALIELKVSKFAPTEKRAEVQKKMDRLRAEAKACSPPDGTFGLLAQANSEDQASRYRGGDVGWIVGGKTNSPWHPSVLSGVSQLKQPGEISPVIETPTAFYLVKLIERQSATMRPLKEVQEGIKYLIIREKERGQQEAAYVALRQGLTIRTNHALIDAIQAPASNISPALPSSPTIHASSTSRQ